MFSFSVVLFCSCASHDRKRTLPSLAVDLTKLEILSRGRIGLSAVNTKSGEHFQFRANERFPFCSTFKVIVVAAILEKSGRDAAFFRKRILFSKKEVEFAGYAPVTGTRYAEGMSIADLCAAAIQHSDNGAANLLIKQLGGIEAISDFASRTGDKAFRLDRWEPELNSAEPKDLRDTTIPAAMEETLKQILLGDVLPISQRQQLQKWLAGNKTGAKRIRAGLSDAWTVGDKTGTCSYGTTNDVGIISSSVDGPIVIAIFFTQDEKDAKPRDDVIASAAQLLSERLK